MFMNLYTEQPTEIFEYIKQCLSSTNNDVLNEPEGKECISFVCQRMLLIQTVRKSINNFKV